VAAVLFETSKALFLWFVTNQAGYAMIYGPVASVIAFLFWCYVAAAILLLGVEVCAAHCRSFFINS
ncbi:MAG: YhjD/YihY/BrkB family envelope integrity protein, partial [Chloroflexota bacterium]